MNRLGVDLNLVRKYHTAGPRYTSYPPATRFTNSLAWPELAEEIVANNRTKRGLSLYFHIPFCESLCWYCGCTTVITTDHSQGEAYLDLIEKELDQMAAAINPDRRVVQIHLGGGTPTFLAPDELRRLGRMIRSRFQIDPGAEAGVEIDPRRLSRAHLEALREAGFNRASVGVQDFDPRVQLAVRRIQPREQTEQAIEWLRELGFGSVNIDLIYGLPHQTARSFSQTLRAVLEIDPDRVAAFSYAHVPWIKPSQKRLEPSLPSPDEKLELLRMAIETLTGNGFVYIGMDHYAKRDDELTIAQRNKTLHRNFQGYSTRGGADIYAFGMSAISQTENAYWQNTKELPDYRAALEAGRSPYARGCLLTAKDKLRRAVIMRLMCDLGLDYAAMSQTLGIDLRARFSREIDSLGDLEEDGLVRRTATGLRITDTGRLFLRNIAMRFDAYLPKETTRMFSKTI